jgi:hypothetical protein
MKSVILKIQRAFAAAIAATLCLPGAIGPARADAVMEWNATAAALPIAVPPVHARVMAAMHGAIYDAINSIDPVHDTYRFPVEAPAGASKDAAVATAAHGVLTVLVPSQKAALDTALSQSLAKISDERSKADGIVVGKTVAERMLAWRAKDNFDAKAEDKPGTGAGVWQRTPPGLAPGALPQLGGVTPFMLKSVDQFAAKGRPALTGEEFTRDLDEIKRLGGRYSTERTADQTAVALFWSGNEIPQLNAVARATSQARKLSMQENARLFALTHTAAADALLVSFRINTRRHGVRSPRSGLATAALPPTRTGNRCSSPRPTRNTPPPTASPRAPSRRCCAISSAPTR